MARGSSSTQQACQGTRQEEQGNWYCRQVQHVTYENMVNSGQYSEVVSMDQQTGDCKFANRSFSGPLAPFDEPLSLHFRGPLNLKQVAVYIPGTPDGKTPQPGNGAGARTGMLSKIKVKAHKPKRKRQHSISGAYSSIPSAYNGSNTASSSDSAKSIRYAVDDKLLLKFQLGAKWIFERIQQQHEHDLRTTSGSPKDPTPFSMLSKALTTETGDMPPQNTMSPSPSTTSGSPKDPIPVSMLPSAFTTESGDVPPQHTMPLTSSSRSGPHLTIVPIMDNTSSSLPSVPASTLSAASGTANQFVRTGYYNAAQQKAEGVMFLGNYGGQGSGRWTPTFGNTQSYINADGTGGAAAPAVLKDTTLLSAHEATLVTDQPCDESCGYVQPGAVAYKGFPGRDKIFLLEFSMPHDNSTTTTTANTTTASTTDFLADQPAIWLLNARIPHTAQYHACNCWASGCGEVDVFEVLSPGGDKATTSVHAADPRSGGGPGGWDYFARPVDVGRPARVAVVFDGARARVAVRVLGEEGGAKELLDGAFPDALTAEVVEGLMEDLKSKLIIDSGL
ncbi:ae76cd03-b6bf-497b-81d4-32f3bc7c4049 [Thermothielavioides terrestris]|uniref:glucan endo-1,3-beta-D-glucosidase n=1 Tax=Thermothielavioides terrestris TaxID=2587410 RepID=A0A446B7Z5_9PEZI|nr:ae76cd03-b6bf-497b-81d4-32f3bc7c4049 [Thermothielavioides terrestris]